MRAGIEDEVRRQTMLARTAVTLAELRRDLMSMSSDIAALDARLTAAEADIAALEAGTVEVLVNERPNVTTTGTIAQKVWSWNLPADKLANVGDWLVIEMYSHHAANANSKITNPTLGGVWAGATNSTGSGNYVRNEILLQKTGVDTQRAWIRSFVDGAAGSIGGQTLTLDDGAAIEIAQNLTTSVQAGDVTLDQVIVKYVPHKAAA